MLNLVLSIVLSSWLILSFKYVERFNISRLQAIVFNYISCVITGCIFIGRIPSPAASFDDPAFKWPVIMGLFFITLFNVTGYTAQKVSVAVASVASKLSLVIPFVFSIFLYNEKAGFFKIAAIVLALAGVYCTVAVSKNEKQENISKPGLLLLLAFILFVGCGLQDTVVKYAEQHYMNADNSNDYLIVAFATAAFVGLILMLLLMLKGKEKFSFKSVLAGVAIGVPNYFSILFLVKALKQYAGNSSAVLPVVNIGIVLCSALAAGILFNEKLSLLNKTGILLSIISIAFFALG